MKNETNDIKMFRPNDSLLYGMIRGAIGKDFVIKKYGKKRVISKYPDMSNIIPSAKQIKRRNIFKNAVEFAGTIYTDEKVKRTIEEFAGTRRGLFQAAIRYYFFKNKKYDAKRVQQTDNLLRSALQKEPKFATDTPGLPKPEAPLRLHESFFSNSVKNETI